MISIHKPSPGPAILRDRGKQAAEELSRLYDSASPDYDSGRKTFDFKDDIYAHESVKEALRVAQRDKCAFCESKMCHTGFGDVEHFRPKGSYKQREGEALGRPGYYWLAYEWSNLLLSCQLCNQRFKKNLFPLKRSGRRALSHHHDVTREEPLLIDPASERPERSLTFREEIVVAVANRRKGLMTIRALGLNRSELVEYRLDRLNRLRLLQGARDKLKKLAGANPPPDVTLQLRQLDDALAGAIADDAEYASMSRTFLRG